MGTWGPHSFDNDDAKDWCQAYREMGLPVAASTLQVALGDVENAGLNADIACRAIAAVEAVCFALGRGSPDAIEAFQGAPEADAERAQELVSNCNYVIMAITGGSELAELWKDAGLDEHDRWIAALTDLRTRVNGEAAEEVNAPSASPTPLASGVDVSVQDQLVDIRNAIGGLEHDIEVLRQEMREGLMAIAKHVSGQS